VKKIESQNEREGDEDETGKPRNFERKSMFPGQKSKFENRDKRGIGDRNLEIFDQQKSTRIQEFRAEITQKGVGNVRKFKNLLKISKVGNLGESKSKVIKIVLPCIFFYFYF
jgi:hypothetical protein